MTETKVDPLVALPSACLAIADGEANEIEMEWRTTSEDRIDQPGVETVLTITVRREVRHLTMSGTTTGDDSE